MLLRTFLLCLCLVQLSACGVKGNLYIPEQQYPLPTSPNTPVP